MSQSRIISAIYDAVDQVIDLDPNTTIDKSPETLLYAKEGGLDSLGLINLIVAVEQNICDAFAVNIVLANEDAMSRANNPFRSIGGLAEYIAELLEGSPDG